MDVILRLLSLPSIFVGFGEGVCKPPTSQPRLHRSKRPTLRGFASCLLLHLSYVALPLATVGFCYTESHGMLLTEGLEIFDGHKLVWSR